ncbi:MAG: sigma 54-interacting transcriptional regulator [Longimicrobiales bacterium]
MGLGQSVAAHERPAGLSREIARDKATLIGGSASFRSVVEMAERVAGYPAANVLLTGETGTGKELFARAIHNASASAGEPFVAINCSAIPETLLESELFGHEKGAFTDARTPKRGLLEVAGRGTVMLDEVNELPLNLQPKLLRVLEERRVRRLGAVNEYEVGCRIIAATNRDLGALAEEGSFRSDLYYRLNVLRIDLPPLRERAEDVERLAEHFVKGISREHGLGQKELTSEALQVLRTHAWLGNVRELKNVLESALVMSDGVEVRPEHIRLRKRATVAVAGDVILAGNATPGHAGSAAAGRAGGSVSRSYSNGGRAAEAPGETHAAPISDSALEPLAMQRNGDVPRSGNEPMTSPVTPGSNATGECGVMIHVPANGVTLDDMERALIAETLRLANGNRSLMARMLGVSRATVIRKIERYRFA